MKNRWLIVALALLSASAFALSVQAGRWWSIDATGFRGAAVDHDMTGPIGDVEIGPFGTHSSFGGAGDLSWAGGSARWQRFGVATWAAGLIAMFVLVVVAGGVAARRMPRLAARTALVAIVTAALVATGFVVARPSNGLPFVVDRGVYLFVAAVLAGVVASVGVLRLARPR